MPFPQKLVHLFFLFNQKIQKKVRQQDTPVSIPEFIALKLIVENKPTTMTGIAELLDVKKASISQMLGKLQSQGFIEKRDDKLDKRQQYIVVSRKGKKIMKEMFMFSSKFMGGAFDVLSDEEQKQLKYLLIKLIKYDENN